MLHDKRQWSVSPITTAEELAEKLTEHIWTLCTAFRLAGTPLYFLNDSTSPDGAQEYAAVRAADGVFRQVESITFSWCDYNRALEFIEELAGGEVFEHWLSTVIDPTRLQTPEEHGRCPLCM